MREWQNMLNSPGWGPAGLVKGRAGSWRPGQGAPGCALPDGVGSGEGVGGARVRWVSTRSTAGGRDARAGRASQQHLASIYLSTEQEDKELSAHTHTQGQSVHTPSYPPSTQQPGPLPRPPPPHTPSSPSTHARSPTLEMRRRASMSLSGATVHDRSSTSARPSSVSASMAARASSPSSPIAPERSAVSAESRRTRSASRRWSSLEHCRVGWDGGRQLHGWRGRAVQGGWWGGGGVGLGMLEHGALATSWRGGRGGVGSRAAPCPRQLQPHWRHKSKPTMSRPARSLWTWVLDSVGVDSCRCSHALVACVQT